MVEVTTKLTLMGNREISEAKLNTYSESHLSAVDRFTNTVIFKAADLPLAEENFIAVSLEDGTVISGNGTPPMDMYMHLAMYRKYPQIGSIAHVYPTKTMNLAQTGKEIPVLGKYHAMYFKHAIRCTRPIAEKEALGKTYAEASAEVVLDELQKDEVLPFGALLLNQDGALVWHELPLKTIDYANYLEKTAEAAWNTLIVAGDACKPMPEDLAARFFEEKQAQLLPVEPCGVPGTKVTDQQARSVNLEMLRYFDRVCRENGVKYSLTGGTLLGAVRHGGVIPWDDDVDVFLTRPEFEKLSAVFPEGGRFEFITYQKDPNFNYVFGRLIDNWTLIEYSPNTAGAGKGLFLDVCIVDGLPDDAKERNRHMRYMRLLVRFRRAVIQNPNRKSYKSKGPVFVMAKKLLRKCTDIHFWNKRINKAMQKYPFDGGKYVGNFTSQYGNKELLHASVFSKYYDVKFEDMTCMICAGYHEYLTNIYKDYMQLPPVNKRKSHHNSNAVWVGPSGGEAAAASAASHVHATV